MRQRISTHFMWLAIAIALAILVWPGPAHAEIVACPSILRSLHADWSATLRWYATPVARRASEEEANPVIRQIGPEVYFATWTIGVAALCKENHAWRVASIIVWAVETLAVNSHIIRGYSPEVPFLIFQHSW